MLFRSIRNSGKLVSFKGRPQNLYFKTFLKECGMIWVLGTQVTNKDMLTYEYSLATAEGVVDEAQCVADAKEGTNAQHGDTQLQAVCVAVLIDLEPVGQSQTSGTECSITRGDGADNDTDHSQCHADITHGLEADVVDSSRCSSLYTVKRTAGRGAEHTDRERTESTSSAFRPG